MQLSIIIPALNEAETIGATLNRLQSDYRSRPYISEFIVVDGGSEDETVRIAKDRGALVLEQVPCGRAIQMNKGIEVAKGEILYFLHSDTSTPPGFAEKIIRAVENGADSGCFQMRFDNRHPVLRFFGWCTRFDLPWFRYGDQSLFVTRRMFNRSGRFDEHLLVMEDNEFIRRLRKLGNFSILPDKVVTAARKYEQTGIMQLQLLFVSIVILYELGASQQVLKDWYTSALRYLGK